jgi:nickel transport protein
MMALYIVMAWSGQAMAHKIDVYAYFDNGRLLGEGAYDDGSAAEGADILLTDAEGKLLGKTKVSPEGAFVLTPEPGRPPLKIEINDRAGHRAEFVINEVLPTATAFPAAPAAPRNVSAARANADLDKEELSKLLRQELAPIKAELARLANRQRIGPSEIIGGMGWLLGLLGLALWLKDRKDTASSKMKYLLG